MMVSTLGKQGTGQYNDHMGRMMTATDAKAKFLALLDEVAEGGEEVAITKHGLPVARLVPASGAYGLEGKLSGIAMTAASDEELFSTGEAWDLP
jgi:prevent-host-death family protein